MIKLKKGVIFLFILVLSAFFVSAQNPIPAESLDPYYTPLAKHLNTSIDSTTGQLWKGLNASFYDFNKNPLYFI